MAGIIDGLLGAALGASGAVVGNAQFARQQQAEQDKESRAMGRKAFLMGLRSKYNKSEADHSDTLARGRAVHQQQLQLDGLNAKQVIEAEQRKRQDDVNEYDLKKMIDDEYASAKEARDNKEWGRRNSIEYGQEKGLVNMRLSAIQARKGSGGGDDDEGDVPLTPEQNAHNAAVMAARKAVRQIKDDDPRLMDNGVNPRFDKRLAEMVALARKPLYGVADRELMAWGDSVGGKRPALKDGIYRDKQGKTYQVVGGKIVGR